jgi:hypothetical protein
MGLPFLDGLPLPFRTTLSSSFSISFFSFLLLGLSGSGSTISYFLLFPFPIFCSSFCTFSGFYGFSDLTTFSSCSVNTFGELKAFTYF